jgi:hypothetical protein
MGQNKSQSLESLVLQHGVAYAPILALDLETGMVLRSEGKLKIVISVSYRNTKIGPIAIIETLDGLRRVDSEARLDVWHINGKPFIVDRGLPLDIPGGWVGGNGGGGAAPLAQDAAGIVPVWRGPKRLN